MHKPKPAKIPAWMFEGVFKSHHELWSYCQWMATDGGGVFSSCIHPLKSSPCSSQCPYAYAHAGSSKRTQGCRKLLNFGSSGDFYVFKRVSLCLNVWEIMLQWTYIYRYFCVMLTLVIVAYDFWRMSTLISTVARLVSDLIWYVWGFFFAPTFL